MLLAYDLHWSRRANFQKAVSVAQLEMGPLKTGAGNGAYWGVLTATKNRAGPEATVQPMARMAALAIGGGWLVTPGVVDPAAAPRLAG